MSTDNVQNLVMAYFQSWQEPADWSAFRGALADDVVFDAGSVVMTGADQLTSALQATESPWQDVTLLASMYAERDAVLFYEGVDKASGVRTRVAEHLALRDGKIEKVIAAIVPLGGPGGTA